MCATTGPTSGCCTRAVFEISNLAEFQRGFADWLKEAEQTALSAFRGLGAFAFAYVVEETPQYTGETVSNWRFSIGMPIYSKSSGIKYERHLQGQSYRGLPVYQKQGWTGDGGVVAQGQGGNPNAMRIARQSLRAGFSAVKSLDDVIVIANATAFTGDRTVGDLENNPGWLRAVNQPGQMIGRMSSYVMSNFKEITAANLKRLMVVPA